MTRLSIYNSYRNERVFLSIAKLVYDHVIVLSSGCEVIDYVNTHVRRLLYSDFLW